MKMSRMKILFVIVVNLAITYFLITDYPETTD